MTGERGRWGLAPGHHAPPPPTPVRPAADDSPPVRLVAVCDLGPRSDDPARVSFDVEEHLVLASGRRVVLHAGERGWTSSYVGPLPRPTWTREAIVRGVLTVVLPDGDDDPEPHPWDWLAGLARTRGVEVAPDELRALPYDVELTTRLEAWLDVH